MAFLGCSPNETRHKKQTCMQCVQFTPTGQGVNYSDVPQQRRPPPPQTLPAPTTPPQTASAAQSHLICQPVLGGKFTFQTLKNQCLSRQQFSGNRHNQILPYILISFPLLTNTNDCCPAYSTSILNDSNFLKCLSNISVI